MVTELSSMKNRGRSLLLCSHTKHDVHWKNARLMNSKIVTGLLMVSGFSGSGVVTDVRRGGRRVWRRSHTVSFISCRSSFNPVNFVTTSVLFVSLVEGLPVLAYVHRRVVPLQSRNCTSVLLVLMTGDWTVLYSLPLSVSLLT
jgi:uncharacterized BrkB/YihY/UPF0761 family membrane protein